MDADLVLIQESMNDLPDLLSRSGFSIDLFPHSVNAQESFKSPSDSVHARSASPRVSVAEFREDSVGATRAGCLSRGRISGKALGLVRHNASPYETQERRVGFTQACRGIS